MRLFHLCAIALLGTLAFGTASHAQDKNAPEAIEVQAREITQFDRRNAQTKRFGALEFAGGLVLQSTHKHFGGFSGLYIAPDGVNFLTHSDRGQWRSRHWHRERRDGAHARTRWPHAHGAQME